VKAKDVMTSAVISVEPETTVLEAARRMLQNHISGLPVVDKAGNLVGIVSEGDFLRRGETDTAQKYSGLLEFLLGPGKAAGQYIHSHGRKVGEVMSNYVHVVEEDTDLEDVVELMERKRIKRVPVVRKNKMIGIITRSNLMHAMVSLARSAPKTASNDAIIRERLVDELAKEKWAPKATTNIVVLNGVVELWGTVFDDRQREALKVAAENIPGVKAVKDHLVWLEPATGMWFA
jgi:CBS domain-containing protein